MDKKVIHSTFLIIVILGIFSLTILHDPLLHGVIAKSYGWEVSDWEKGILSGFTNATVSTIEYEQTSTAKIWFYFMGPPLILFFIPFLLLLSNPNRYLAIVVILLMFLNFASLSPEAMLPGSDSSQAMNVLMERGVSPLISMIIHWGIFIIAIVSLGTAFYVMFENDQRDAEGRVNTALRRGKS